MSLEQPVSTSPPAPPPPLSRDSPGMESDYCSDYGSLSSGTDPDSHRHGQMPTKSEELSVLEQLMSGPGSEFGFVLDRNGTIEMVLGKTQPIFGNVQIENQKLLKFVDSTEYQKVCGLLPSAKSSSTRKSSHLTFCCEKGKGNLEMEIISQLISANPDNPEKGPCVVCVAKRLITEQVPQMPLPQDARHPISFSLSVDKSSRIIKQADLRMDPKLLDVSHFLDKSLYELCFKTNREVIDSLMDANSPRQAKLALCINEFQILVDIANFFDPNSSQIRLECNGVFEISPENFQDEKSEAIFVTQPQLEVMTQHQVMTTTASGFPQPQFVQVASFEMPMSGALGQNGQIVGEVEQPAKKQRKPRKPRSPNAPPPKRSRAKKPKEPEMETPQAWAAQFEDPMKPLMGQAYQAPDGTFYYSPPMGPPPPYGATNQPMPANPEADFADPKPKGRGKKGGKKNSTQQNQPQAQFIYQPQMAAEMQHQFGYPIHQEFAGASTPEGYGTFDPSTSMSSQVASSIPHHPNMPQPQANGGYANQMSMNAMHLQQQFHPSMNPNSQPQNWSGSMGNPQQPQPDFHLYNQQQQQQQQQQQNMNMQMYQQQGQMSQQQMMQLQQQQQQQKKGAQKRKNGQTPAPVNARPVKQPFMGQGFQQQQQYQQGYNGMMQQQQPVTQPNTMNNYNGSMQQQTPPNMGQYQNYNQQWMKDAVKRELRNTVVARQAVSPNQAAPNMPQGMNMMPEMEMNRFAGTSSTPPNHNILTSPRMMNNMPPYDYRNNIGPPVQNPQRPVQQFLPELSLDDCKSYLHGDDPSAPLSAIDTTIMDFKICEDKFDMDNEDTRKFVHKLLS